MSLDFFTFRVSNVIASCRLLLANLGLYPPLHEGRKPVCGSVRNDQKESYLRFVPPWIKYHIRRTQEVLLSSTAVLVYSSICLCYEIALGDCTTCFLFVCIIWSLINWCFASLMRPPWLFKSFSSCKFFVPAAEQCI